MSHLVIIGSGLVGLTAALALHQAGRRVTVLSQSPLREGGDGSDERPLSLSLTTQTCLQNIALWDALRFQAAAIEAVHVSEERCWGALYLQAKLIDAHALGYVVPFGFLYQALAQAVELAGIEYQVIDDVLDIEETDEVVLTVRQAGVTCHKQADYCIAADGMHSRCRALLGIRTDVKAKGDTAHSAVVTCDVPHAHQAYQRFARDGIWAMLPMWKPHQYRLVWTAPASIKCEEAHWLQRLQQVYGRYIPGIQTLTPTGSYPLKAQVSQQQATKRCVLLGDSAHRLYPISAQGYNLSVRDIAALVDVMTQQGTLSDYVAQRQPDQQRIVRATHGLEQVVGLSVPGARWVRALGLGLLDLQPRLKRQLIHTLLGQSTQQASLLCHTLFR